MRAAGSLIIGLLVTAACAPTAEKGPAAAPVVLMVFADFGAPEAERSKAALDELLNAYPGKIRLIFKHAPLSGAVLAHEAALAAEAQGKFWEMQGRLYGPAARSDAARLTEIARQAGLDTAAFNAALRDHRYLKAVERDLAEAKALGLDNAPAVATLRTIVNQELGLPAQVRTQGAPRRGPANAPVTLVEFSDFQCGFCTRALATVRQVMKEYPTQVQWVFKHYPLEMHRDAPLAHEAALAAGAQGKFWEMHDLLFERKTLQRDQLISLAKELGLNVAQFTRDLDSHKFRGAVEADRREGAELGVDGTPTFFINGRALVGAQPIDQFRKLIQAELKR